MIKWCAYIENNVVHTRISEIELVDDRYFIVDEKIQNLCGRQCYYDDLALFPANLLRHTEWDALDGLHEEIHKKEIQLKADLILNTNNMYLVQKKIFKEFLKASQE